MQRKILASTHQPGFPSGGRGDGEGIGYAF